MKKEIEIEGYSTEVGIEAERWMERESEGRI